jgi:hypothetical protein
MNSASVFARRVFPVPEGPQRRKEAMGRLVLPRPERLSLTAFDTALTASGWPTRERLRIFSIWRSFCFSVVIRPAGKEKEGRYGQQVT